MSGKIIKRRRKRGDGGLYKPERSPYFWTKIYHGGRAYCESTKTDNQRQALIILRQRMTQIDKGIAPSADPKTVDYWVEKKLAKDKEEFEAGTGAFSYKTTLGRWTRHLRPFFTGMVAADVNNDDLENYRDDRLDEDADEPVKGSTINREFALLRTSIYMDKNIKGRLTFPMCEESEGNMGFLEDHEIDDFIEACRKEGEWLAGMVSISLEYAWRKGEVRDLRVGVNVDFKTNMITLHRTKNGDARTVGMTDHVRDILLKLCEGKINRPTLAAPLSG